MNRLALSCSVFLAAAAVLATACPAPAATPAPTSALTPLVASTLLPSQQSLLDFTTIEQSPGHAPFYPEKDPRLVVISSSEEAQTDVPSYLYPEVQRANDPSDTLAQTKRNDFARSFIVAAFQGYGGAGIRVSRIWLESTMVVIEARFEQAAGGRTLEQSPYHVLRVSKAGIPQGVGIQFVLTDQTGRDQFTTVHTLPALTTLTSSPGPTPFPTPWPWGTLPYTPLPTRSPTPTHTPYPGYVDLRILPEFQSVMVGERFLVTLQVDAEGPLAGIDSFVDFDPGYLVAVSVQGGEDLPVPLMNRYDNETGRIDFSAGAQLGGEPPTGRLVLATIEFEAKERTRGTTVGFSQTWERQTNAAYEGRAVLGDVTGAMVEIW